MTTSQKRKLIALACLAAAIVPTAITARRPAVELLWAIRSYGPAHEVQARLAQTRSALQHLAQAGRQDLEGGDAVVPDSFREAARTELRSLLALLDSDPAQRQRLDRLGELARRSAWLDAPGAEGGDPARVLEIEGLVGELEQDQQVHLRRLDALAGAALQDLMLVGVVGGAGALLILLALGLVPWDWIHRRWDARRVARLLARQRELTDRLHYLDLYDPLTGLPNRKSLIQRMEQAIRWAREGGRGLAVLIVDVNRLRHVNDLFGIEAGDQAVRKIAEALRDQASDRDIVARVTGGEFAVVLLDASPTFDVASRAEQVQHALSRSHGTESDYLVTSSIGVSSYPGHGQDAPTLLRNADLALVKARSVGRNTIQVFDDQIKTAVSDLFRMEKRLSHALKNGEYRVHYQPCCDLVTNQVAGAEALVKWMSPEAGVIAASKFIPVLEDTGMIVEVGQWVLESACRQVKDWQARDRLLPVAVNLSLAQFRDRFLVDMVADAIGAFGLDPAHLALEITESVCLQDLEFAIRTLKRLKDLGVSISVDDFGTGYSSLSYLKKLPVDTVKIDISFVRDVARDQDAVSIVTAITALARSLKLTTVAEGIETEEQRRMLHLLRCDQGQGYLFSPALPAPQFEAFAAQERKPQADLLRTP